MFMLFGPGAQCACLAGVVVAGSACLYCTYRQIMACPHPTEWQPLGDVCYAVGCHTHRKFNLVVEIHEADRMGKGKFQFEAELGRTNGTTEVMEKDGKINQALHLHCRQRDMTLTIKCSRVGLIKNEELAFLEIPVEPELTENQPPKAIGPKWYVMKDVKDKRNFGRIQITLHPMPPGSDPNSADETSPLFFHALKKAQEEAANRGEEFQMVDLASMKPQDKLRFYSRALDGPVQKMNALGVWTNIYMKAEEYKKYKWQLAFYKNEADIANGKPPYERMNFLQVAAVLRDTGERKNFILRYVDEKGVERTIMFKQVDRDRDIWVDGMYDFIEQFREFKDDERDKKSAKKEKLEAKKQRQEAKASGNEADESDGGAIRKKATKKAGAKKKHNKEESGTEAATATGAGTPSESEALLSEAPKKRVTKKK